MKLSSFSLDSLFEIFIFETSQLMEQLERSVISGESNRDFPPMLIDDIMRCMHTVKGSAAVMEFGHIARLSHALEDLFYYLREHRPVTVDYSAISDLVLEGCDFIKLEIYKLKNGDGAEGEADGLIRKTGEYLDVLKQSAAVEADPQEFIHTYTATVGFASDCEMPNIRAYTLVRRLEEAGYEVRYSPSDMLDNESSAAVIRDQGLTLWIRTEASEDEVRRAIEGTPYLKSFVLSACPLEEWTPEMAAAFGIYAASRTAGPEFIKETAPLRSPGSLSAGQHSMISVQVAKLDRLMDLVGELVVSEAMVTQHPELQDLSLDQFAKASRQLRKITGEIQDTVMSIRMVPLAATFHKMGRIVRDMSQQMGKEMLLKLEGEETEVDKNLIEHISDPLMHLIRNAADHGIEYPAERELRRKQSAGTITLGARHVGNEVHVIVRDDGQGLDRNKLLEQAAANGVLPEAAGDMTDREVFALIFLPGFSTKEQVTEYSGRGVGMDVVMRNIQAVGGTIVVDSEPDKGTMITLKLPLTMAIVYGMNIRVGKSRFTLPTVSIRESFRAARADVITDPDGREMLMVRGLCYPVLRLHRFFGIRGDAAEADEGIMVMVESERDTFCLFADELLGEQQVVVKALPEYIRRVKDIQGLGGCTLLGDGSISLILDIAGLTRVFHSREQ